jgi:hypothetical protein
MLSVAFFERAKKATERNSSRNRIRACLKVDLELCGANNIQYCWHGTDMVEDFSLLD